MTFPFEKIAAIGPLGKIAFIWLAQVPWSIAITGEFQEKRFSWLRLGNDHVDMAATNELGPLSSFAQGDLKICTVLFVLLTKR